MFSLSGQEGTMTPVGHSSGRFLGYVQVQVASRTYSLRVEALPPQRADGDASERKTGFFAAGGERFGILVDGEAPQSVVDKTIEKASEDATRHIARTLLN